MIHGKLYTTSNAARDEDEAIKSLELEESGIKVFLCHDITVTVSRKARATWYACVRVVYALGPGRRVSLSIFRELFIATFRT